MKLGLRPGDCTGHGRCYELAPEIFGEDERGHCRILRESVPEELVAKARTAVANCPEKALFIEGESETE